MGKLVEGARLFRTVKSSTYKKTRSMSGSFCIYGGGRWIRTIEGSAVRFTV